MNAILQIAARNITSRRFRSGGILLLTCFGVFMITASAWLKAGLQNGVESLSARLGADVMLVPSRAENDFEGALLSGTPSAFYIPKTVAEKLSAVSGVSETTSQLFISTFNSEHCAALVQIIGYDPETDFVVRPWLNGSDIPAPSFGELVAGSNIKRRAGEKMLLFSKEYTVAANLEKTGMGFDNCVFVTTDTAEALLKEYRTFHEASPLPEGKNAEDVVSAVLFNIADGYKTEEVQKEINEYFRRDNIKTVTNKALISSTSKNLGAIYGILTVLSVGFWLFAVISLMIIWALSLNGRKREFAVLRAVGGTVKTLSRIIIAESLILSAAGAVIGAAGALWGVSLYNALIEASLSAAYLPPKNLSAALIAAVSAISGIAAGLAACCFSVYVISKDEAAAGIKDGN
jgi:putative ABC transport system permease protein